MIVIAALLLILFIFRPGVFELRNRISSSIGNALGRRVTIDNVRLHVLPRPGFDLEGLVIYDDPSFNAEPMIRAQDVFAAIRLRSLLRGRLEIAMLSATEPSVNIVRAGDGRWNLASLIERNAKIPAAPTQKSKSERRPAFPYLEASNARINFKFGQVKTSYALVDADVALWQDSENSWAARMKAQPVRTDFNLTDTGQIQINAAWQRAATLKLTPMQVSVTWQKGQLGQITNLLTGKDRGWRGGVDLTASLSGTAEALAIDSQATIQSFHRYDILDKRNVNLAVHCSGRYNITTVMLRELLCQSPVRDGTLRLYGNFAGIGAPYDLSLEAKKIPIASLVELAHEAKQQLPPDLTAEGLLDAEFHAVRNSSSPAQFSGSGVASDTRLISKSANDSVALGNVPLTLVSEGCCKNASAHRLAPLKLNVTLSDSEPLEPHLKLGPTSLLVNASSPAIAGGWISASGYRFFLRGDLNLENLFRLENVFGVPASQPAAEGSARLDVNISGPWQGLAAPKTLGTALLRNVRAEMRGLNTPIEIASADVMLASDTASIQQLSARTGGTHWTGSIHAPRRCAPNCLFEFDLAVDHLMTQDLADWFTLHPAKRPWYRILSSGGQVGPSPLLALQAHGTLHIAQFEIKKALATNVTTELTADHGKVTLGHLRAQFLRGTHQGDWVIDASSPPLKYHGAGTFQSVSLDRLGALMNDPWITGNADGAFEIDTSGASFHEILENSDGKLKFTMRNGTFAHVALPEAPTPFSVYRFSGNLRVKDGKWQLPPSKLQSRDGLYQVSGTSSFDGLNFKFTRGDEHSWNLTGTLARLQIAPTNQEISRTEAATKTEAKP